MAVVSPHVDGQPKVGVSKHALTEVPFLERRE